MTWADRFQARDSALCVGLDPAPGRIPPGLTPATFCLEVIEATADLAACFKPNVAFFERLGWEGLRDLATRIAPAIRAAGVPVLYDAKRGDVPSTAQAYAEAWLGGPFAGDALTVNPSVGLDSLEPFRARAHAVDGGVFVLLRTSNPGAEPFQAACEPLLVDAIRAEPAFGAVVGATDPRTGARLRDALPDTLLLVPGFGAQGGNDLRPFFRADGRGAIVNSSRGILYAGEGRPDWRVAVRDAAQRAHAAIERARGA